MSRNRNLRVCQWVGCTAMFPVGHASGVSHSERFCPQHRSDDQKAAYERDVERMESLFPRAGADA